MLAWLGLALLLALAGALCRLRAWGAHRGGAELLACAFLLELLLAGDLVSLGLRELVLAPARAAGAVPFAGLARAAFHGTQLAFLAWPFGVAALVAHLFARDRLLGPAFVGVGLLVLACFAGSYPEMRGEALANGYRTALLLALFLALAGLTLPRPDRFRAGRAHLISLLLLAGLAAELAGPYLADPFGSWWTAQVSWSLVLGAVSGAAVWGGPWRTAPAL